MPAITGMSAMKVKLPEVTREILCNREIADARRQKTVLFVEGKGGVTI